MKKTMLSAILILTLAVVAHAGEPLAIGDKAVKTDVKMKNVDGEMVSIADVAGVKGTLVIVSCIHCPYVKGWETRMTELGNTYNDKGIGVIMINSNDPERSGDTYDKMQERHSALGMEFPFAVDAGSEVAAAFGASVTPEAFLFDENWELVYHGTIDDNMRDVSAVDETYLADALDAVAKDKPVQMAETKALGCTIKWYK